MGRVQNFFTLFVQTWYQDLEPCLKLSSIFPIPLPWKTCKSLYLRKKELSTLDVVSWICWIGPRWPSNRLLSRYRVVLLVSHRGKQSIKNVELFMCMRVLIFCQLWSQTMWRLSHLWSIGSNMFTRIEWEFESSVKTTTFHFNMCWRNWNVFSAATLWTKEIFLKLLFAHWPVISCNFQTSPITGKLREMFGSYRKWRENQEKSQYIMGSYGKLIRSYWKSRVVACDHGKLLQMRVLENHNTGNYRKSQDNHGISRVTLCRLLALPPSVSKVIGLTPSRMSHFAKFLA